MAYEFLKQLEDSAARKAWLSKPAKPPKNPMPGMRKKVTDGIDRTLAQLKAGEKNPKRGWYQSRDDLDTIRCTIKYGNKPLVLDGDNFWPARDATKFYNAIKQRVNSGELDEAIKAAAASKGGSQGSAAARTGRTLDPAKVHNRNIQRYGADRANELLKQKYSEAEAADIRKRALVYSV